MRIAILTAGSRGDVQPYVALGAALQRAGHAVRVAAYEIFEPLVTGAGLSFTPCRGLNPQTFMDQPELRAAQRTGNQAVVFMTIFRVAGPLIAQVLDAYWESAQGCDALILSAVYAGGYDCAEKLRVPAVFTMLVPVFPTRAFPNPFFGPMPRLGGAFNRLTHWLFDQMIWQFLGRTVNAWRKKTLGLPPQPFFGPFGRIQAERPLTLCGFSPQVAAPPDWPAHLHLTGYWFFDEPEGWQPPADLVRFLEAGPPPVCIGFGSMSNENPERLTRVAVEALRLSGQRGVLLSGWGALQTASLPGSVFPLASVSHSWLFPYMAALVHHGGAGTTAAGLRAGVPALLTPFVADQFFWAQRVSALGVGPRPIPAAQLTAPCLAAAITALVSDTAMRARAAALGEKIRAEDGAVRAATLIQSLPSLR